MIIPTADFDPMFARDGVPFRDKMLAYIGREFGELLTSQPAAAATVQQLARESAASATTAAGYASRLGNQAGSPLDRAA